MRARSSEGEIVRLRYRICHQRTTREGIEWRDQLRRPYGDQNRLAALIALAYKPLTVLQGDGEVNQVAGLEMLLVSEQVKVAEERCLQIEILGLPVRKLSPALWLDVLGFLYGLRRCFDQSPIHVKCVMTVQSYFESVPQFGNDEDILSLDQALIDGSLETLPGLVLVGVIARRVEHPVPRLDGLVDRLRTCILRDLPETLVNREFRLAFTSE